VNWTRREVGISGGRVKSSSAGHLGRAEQPVADVQLQLAVDHGTPPVSATWPRSRCSSLSSPCLTAGGAHGKRTEPCRGVGPSPPSSKLVSRPHSPPTAGDNLCRANPMTRLQPLAFGSTDSSTGLTHRPRTAPPGLSQELGYAPTCIGEHPVLPVPPDGWFHPRYILGDANGWRRCARWGTARAGLLCANASARGVEA
jgi:hypothetical protein